MGGVEPARTSSARPRRRQARRDRQQGAAGHARPGTGGGRAGSGHRLRFEAAVAGGIPVLGPLALDLAANQIHAIRGIVNGTTNFILTAMARDARSYADVLAEAQARGYAEADPSADVEGHDAAHKLTFLARLAFGVWLDPASASAARRRPPG